MTANFGVSLDTSRAHRTIKLIEAMPREMKAGIAEVLRDEAKGAARDTRILLRQKRGRRASRGEPPAVQTGKLARSIGFKRGRRDGLSYVVQAREFYARFLEARGYPHVTLAVDRRSDRMWDGIVLAIIRTIEGSG